MKSTIITVAVIVLSMNVATAQKVKEAEVPKAVVTSFQTHFKGAKAEGWDKEKNGEYEAEFKMNKVEMSANFSADGTLMETETEIATNTLQSRIAFKQRLVSPLAEPSLPALSAFSFEQPDRLNSGSKLVCGC